MLGLLSILHLSLLLSLSSTGFFLRHQRYKYQELLEWPRCSLSVSYMFLYHLSTQTIFLCILSEFVSVYLCILYLCIPARICPRVEAPGSLACDASGCTNWPPAHCTPAHQHTAQTGHQQCWSSTSSTTDEKPNDAQSSKNTATCQSHS